MVQALGANGIYSESEWQALAQSQLERASKWTRPYRDRRAKSALHPIYDFLFIYYRIKPSHLETWHPGLGVGLLGANAHPEFSNRHYETSGNVTRLSPKLMDDATRHRLEMALRLCETVSERPARFGCYGMHEWAMVYQGKAKDGEIRHRESLPLRLSQAEIDSFVESQPIACSHYDAFRFFTKSAMPFNKISPAKESRLENEQCGCLHTNMDLYKLSGQCMPWVGSDLLWRSFEFALEARKLDMQASPYDCCSLGYAPICIETEVGRLEYETRQRELSELAVPIRDELIRRLRDVLT